jgi:ribosomal protein L12E/L44/L45/RPP1/RPP2
MSTAWETTTDDVANVLRAHGINVSDERLEELVDMLDHDAIKENLLNYCSMKLQTNCCYSDIEDQLMVQGVIPKGEKQWVLTAEDEEDYEDDEGNPDDDDFDDDDE